MQEVTDAAETLLTDLEKQLQGEVVQYQQLQGSESVDFCEVHLQLSLNVLLGADRFATANWLDLSAK